jgi:hypothetical protein
LLVSAEWHDFLFAVDSLPKQEIDVSDELSLKWISVSNDLSSWQLICTHDEWETYQYGECIGEVTATPFGNQVALVLSEYNGANWEAIISERSLPPHPAFLQRIKEGHTSLMFHVQPMLQRLHARGWPVRAFASESDSTIQTLDDDTLLIDFTVPPLESIRFMCRGKRNDLQIAVQGFVERIHERTGSRNYQVVFHDKLDWSYVVTTRRQSFDEPERVTTGRIRITGSSNELQMSISALMRFRHRPYEWSEALPFVAGLIEELRQGKTWLPQRVATLQEKLASRFSWEELRSFTVTLGVDHEDIRGETKSAYAREIVLHFYRHDRIDEVENLYKRLRPDDA